MRRRAQAARERGPHTMRVIQLWRYPVKSLAGERLEAADLGLDGIRGDRVVQVRDAAGRIITSRTRHRLLGLKGTLGPDGEPLIDGRPWRSPDATLAVRRAAGDGARLTRESDRFDVLPLLVATDGALDRLGVDWRRLRPNIIIGGVDGLAERSWPGRRLRAGGAIIGVRKLRQRCVMTTFDPDTLEQDVSVLKRIYEEFNGTMALDCEVLVEGRVAVDDAVELLP
jgi:MOSC domain-containing protein